jgi:hypothetical protein
MGALGSEFGFGEIWRGMKWGQGALESCVGIEAEGLAAKSAERGSS